MIKVQNIYYMLAYAFQVLKEDKYADIACEEFDNISNLFAAILVKGISNQVKRGLGKEYIYNTGALSSPRGKINISASVKLLAQQKKQLVCEFDEFAENVYMNQILKTTAMLLVRSEEVDRELQKALKKVMLFFSDVDIVNPYSITWSRIRYHRNNATYKMLMNICYLVLSGLLLTTQDGTRKLATYLDDQKMHKLFEKFVLEYYKRHFAQLGAAPSHIDWNVDDGVIDFLPTMKSDITLQYNDKILIIDTKYYTSTMQKYFDSSKIHSNNLYQIFTYVKNKDVQASGKVSGVLLYAKTDEEITPDNDYTICGSKISVKTLDLNNQFSDIAKQLNALVEGLYE